MDNYVTAREIMDELGIKQSKAYSIIKSLNSELESQGYLTIAGKVSRKFFEKKWYGYTKTERND